VDRALSCSEICGASADCRFRITDSVIIDLKLWSHGQLPQEEYMEDTWQFQIRITVVPELADSLRARG
jgi:hypothetical protein